MKNYNDNNIISHFVKYQAVYGLVAYLIITWTIYGSEIKHLQENDIKQDTKIELNALNGAEINTRLASIETSLEFIKQQVKR